MVQALLVPSAWSSLPEEFRDRLGTTVGRQRCMRSEGQLLIVAHLVPEHDEASRRGILFWRDASGAKTFWIAFQPSGVFRFQSPTPRTIAWS